MTTWRNLAACRNHPAELWYPNTPGRHTEAKLICAMCPAQIGCAREALANRERHGIWAGVPLERVDITRARAKLRAIAGDTP